jgi:hypothetical protein
MLKKLALCVGVLFAVVANAELSSHAKLMGQRMNGTSLICEYAGAHAKYEILAQHGACAPFIEVQ